MLGCAAAVCCLRHDQLLRRPAGGGGFGLARGFWAWSSVCPSVWAVQLLGLDRTAETPTLDISSEDVRPLGAVVHALAVEGRDGGGRRGAC